MIDPAEVNPAVGWASASLRIATDNLAPDAITERLGIEPTSTRSSEGEPSFSVWTLGSNLEPSASAGDHLYLLIERLRDHRSELAELASSATVEIWLSFSSDLARAAVLGHSLLAELGAWGVDLVIDPYPGHRRGVGEPKRTPESAAEVSRDDE